MDFLSGLAKGGDSKNSGDKKSATDLFASAKVVAEAAQAQFSNQPEKCDKGKAAGAGADLLDAASDYGELDATKGVGKYVDQAETYLRQYGGTPQSAAAAAAAAEGKPVPAEIPSGGEAKKAEEHLSKPSEGGAEDYIKKAEEFLNKPSGGGGEKGEKEGGYGDLLKAAGGFFNK